MFQFKVVIKKEAQACPTFECKGGKCVLRPSPWPEITISHVIIII
jgi:hypothetical protein